MDKTQLLQAQLQSEQGTVGAPIPVTGTSAVPTLGCTAFQVWTADTIIASITINGTEITSFAAVELPSGFIVYGIITTVTLSAGTGLAYKGVININ